MSTDDDKKPKWLPPEQWLEVRPDAWRDKDNKLVEYRRDAKGDVKPYVVLKGREEGPFPTNREALERAREITREVSLSDEELIAQYTGEVKRYAMDEQAVDRQRRVINGQWVNFKLENKHKQKVKQIEETNDEN